MEQVILVVHILACIAMTALVLVQKSEGGALGIGGGGGGGGLMSGRGAAGALVRMTMLFGGIFFITSLTLTTLSTRSDDGLSAIERAKDAAQDGEESGPVDLFDPNAPLLDGQTAPIITPDEATQTDETSDIIDPLSVPAENPQDDETGSNPQ
jgi:preprotein translocase subunit SecG